MNPPEQSREQLLESTSPSLPCEAASVSPRTEVDASASPSTTTSTRATSFSPTPSETLKLAQTSVRQGMRWVGCLSDDAIEQLKAEFGSNIICPGYTSQFGRDADDNGRLYLPGCAQGRSRTAATLTAWQQKQASNDKFSWWTEYLSTSQTAGITVKDILEGCQLETWRAYADVYRRRVVVRNQARARQKRYERARQMAQESEPVDAAVTLAGIMKEKEKE